MALLITEIIIAAFVNDSFIRPYFGDFLVVIFIYCTVKSFINIPWLPAVIGVLIFAYLVETLQYLHFIRWIGLEKLTLARVILGSSFAWTDIVAYTLGVICISCVEVKRYKGK
ncbi:ribosomal maturation YjgA family protein [Mucilaginibacter limnophilus]|uniref:ribosomal maturation YjgA family protein n=1 Tax=Mucilaginibacter limnophilus TaxID=1932778 RepID=UPI00197B490A|nr:DUF2809 domain-containing protein [Mucilaginibacter limnophilus]